MEQLHTYVIDYVVIYARNLSEAYLSFREYMLSGK